MPWCRACSRQAQGAACTQPPAPAPPFGLKRWCGSWWEALCSKGSSRENLPSCQNCRVLFSNGRLKSFGWGIGRTEHK